MAIIEAVTSGDPEVAERTMREHLLSVIGALHQLAEMGVVPHIGPLPPAADRVARGATS